MSLNRTLALSLLLFITHGASAITIILQHLQHSACGEPNGAIDIAVVGGVQPFSFQWNEGSTMEDLTGLSPGTYSVTVTDANSDQALGQWTVGISPLTSLPSAQDGHASCTGSMSGRVQVIEWGLNGTPPYSYSPPPDGFDPQGDPYFTFWMTPPGSTVSIEVTDANGCTGTLYQTIAAPQLIGGPNMQVSNIQGSCTTGSGGSVTISNINDGAFFGAPSYALLDAAQQNFGSGWSAPNTLNFSGLPPGNYHFERDWDPSGYIMAYPCIGVPYDRVDFTIPDLGPDCGSVSGLVFIDNDQDCVQDGGEVGVPYQVLQVLPGAGYTITDAAGNYHIDLVNGSYSLAQTDPTLIPICPPVAPAPFTINYAAVTLNLADSSTVQLDLAAQLASSPMRPGFAGTYWGRVRNLSPQVSGAVTVTLAIDPALVFTGAAPTPDDVTGNTLTWQFSSFTALQSVDLNVSVQVPASMFLGVPLSSTLTVQNTLSDADPANNTAAVDQLSQGSYDPNDKTARTSSRWSDALYFIDQDEWIDYVIRFQNTGTDTAFNVVITDTLSFALNMASFQQGAASHPFTVSIKPGRVIEWRFADILLPDSSVNEAASHGMVSFRIRPAQPLLPGTVIENIANIYFDYNEPVITEPSVLVAEFSTAMHEQDGIHLRLQPNPASDQLRVSSDALIETILILASDGREVIGHISRGTLAAINVSSLPSGVYFLVAHLNNGIIARERFIKQ